MAYREEFCTQSEIFLEARCLGDAVHIFSFLVESRPIQNHKNLVCASLKDLVKPNRDQIPNIYVAVYILWANERGSPFLCTVLTF